MANEDLKSRREFLAFLGVVGLSAVGGIALARERSKSERKEIAERLRLGEVQTVPDAVYQGEILVRKGSVIQVVPQVAEDLDDPTIVPWEAIHSINGVELGDANGFTIANPEVVHYPIHASSSEEPVWMPFLQMDGKVRIRQLPGLEPFDTNLYAPLGDFVRDPQSNLPSITGTENGVYTLNNGSLALPAAEIGKITPLRS